MQNHTSHCEKEDGKIETKFTGGAVCVLEINRKGISGNTEIFSELQTLQGNNASLQVTSKSTQLN